MDNRMEDLRLQIELFEEKLITLTKAMKEFSDRLDKLESEDISITSVDNDISLDL